MASVAVMILLCAGCFTDVFGVDTRVPDAGEVASVSVIGSLNYPYDSGSLGSVTVTDPDQIGEIIALHQAIVENRDSYSYGSPNYEAGDDYISLVVTYTLKDGSALSREYYSVPIFKAELEQEGTVTWCAAQLNADRDFVAACYDFDWYEQGRLVEAYLNRLNFLRSSPLDEGGYQDTLYLDGAAGEDLEGLWQAVRADFADGTIGVRYLFDDQERLDHTYESDLVFCFDMTNLTNSAGKGPGTGSLSEFSITLTPDASRTLDWLRTFSNLGTRYELIAHETVPAA